jgi:hypothetical protein
MAADARVLACAIHAPVTWLPALTEFRDLADNPIIRRSNALALADRLAGRSLFVAIGNTDARVGADHARALCERLRSGVVTADVEEFTMPGDSHKAGFPEELGCQAGAAFLLHRIARKAKEDLWRNKP